jgi:Uma2 family endonuclease
MGALDSLARRKLSISEFHRMGEAGILREDDRIELIHGEMIEMAPIGSRHAGAVNRLSRILTLASGTDAVVATQNPLALPPDNEPQPDIALLKPRTDDYGGSLPDAGDVLLIIEVADTTLGYDRDLKLPLYAQHRVPEVWLVDLQSGSLSIYLDPAPQGYRHVLTPRNDETIWPTLLPKVKLNLSEFWRQ